MTKYVMTTRCPKMKVRLVSRFRPIKGLRRADELLSRTKLYIDDKVWEFDLVFPQTDVAYNAERRELTLPDGSRIVPDRIVAPCVARGEIAPYCPVWISYDEEAVVDGDGMLGGDMNVKPCLGRGGAILPDGRLVLIRSMLPDTVGRPDGWFGWKSYTVDAVIFSSVVEVVEETKLGVAL